MKRLASIDVGTNTLRLLIAEINSDGIYRPVYRDRAITRLGGNFLKDERKINKVSAARTLSALIGFSRSLSRFEVDSMDGVKVVGTSVLRRAENKEAFIDEAFEKTGLKIDVISGEEEALLTLKGVLQVIGDKERAVIIDIGGGSTEFVFEDIGREIGLYSVEMGVVSLTEEFLLSDPPSFKELSGMEKRIEHRLASLLSNIKECVTDLSSFSDDKAILVGTAGTPTTLAAMELALEVYKPEKVNGYTLSIHRLKDIYRFLSTLTTTERSRIPSIENGREDVIVSGIAIIIVIMKVFGFKEMVVSDSGLLEGTLLDLIEKNLFSLRRVSI